MLKTVPITGKHFFYPAKRVQKNVLDWFNHHGRTSLPWQENKSPYRIWISEIMLQQTQVNTVIPYFQRFITRFSTLHQLADASEDEVLHLWTGLGYYSRARHLHRTAREIMHSPEQQFPSDLHALQALPGIGRSTAGAILAIAFEKRAAILDGNVKRVLTRLHAITAWPGEKKVHELLWQLAEHYTPRARVADYTQAMMDLGAIVCTRSKPHCERCPLQKDCQAYQQDLTRSIPAKKPTRTLPQKKATLLVIQKTGQHVLLEKRPSQGIWGGLWSLPEINEHLTLPAIKKYYRQNFSGQVKTVTFGNSFRHTFSHYHLDILPVFIHLSDLPKFPHVAGAQQCWYSLQQPPALGLPAPIKTLLTRMTL